MSGFIYVLALAVFAQGTSEFMLSGLVPAIADDLSVSITATASLTSAYAIGMIAGAPAMAALSARWPRRRALAGFLAAFVIVHVIGAVTTSFPVLFSTRVVAAVVNAGFLAVAMSVAATPRATAVLLSGVTLSCVAGVPAGALLGDLAGWRSVFWAVAALCLPALALVFRAAPSAAAGQPDVRQELRELRSRPVQRVMTLAALVNGATFATFAYLAVVATDVARLPDGAVPGLLAAFGVGAFVGVNVAGRAGELPPGLFLALPAGWAVLALTSVHPVALFVMAVVQGGLSFGVGSALVARVMHVAPGAPTLSGSYATAALNVGAFTGPLIAGVAEYRYVPVVSAVLAAAAVPIALTRRTRSPL